MCRLKWIVFMALFLIFLPRVDAQRDIAVHTGKPWERIEQQRDAIESTILSGDVGGGFVLSASHLNEWKDTPAFLDIVTSVYRGYDGECNGYSNTTPCWNTNPDTESICDELYGRRPVWSLQLRKGLQQYRMLQQHTDCRIPLYKRTDLLWFSNATNSMAHSRCHIPTV